MYVYVHIPALTHNTHGKCHFKLLCKTFVYVEFGAPCGQSNTSSIFAVFPRRISTLTRLNKNLNLLSFNHQV